jgi:hypothetical protein
MRRRRRWYFYIRNSSKRFRLRQPSQALDAIASFFERGYAADAANEGHGSSSTVPGTKIGDRALLGGRVSVVLPMDIVAAMLAYLTCVTGIVGALAISTYVYLVAPQPAAAPLQTATLAVQIDDGKISTTKANQNKIGGVTTRATRTATAAERKPLTTIAHSTDDALARNNVLARNNALAPKPVALDARQKGQLSRAELRRLAQEQRAKRWAYQQDDSFEARFMSYAD